MFNLILTFIKRIKPQILAALLALTVLGYLGVQADHMEVATATIGGIIAISMRLLESDKNEEED